MKELPFNFLNKYISDEMAQVYAISPSTCIVAEKKAETLRKSARKTAKRIVLAESGDEEEPFASDDEDPSLSIAWSLGVIPVPKNGGFNVKPAANGATQSALGYQKHQSV